MLSNGRSGKVQTIGLAVVFATFFSLPGLGAETSAIEAESVGQIASLPSHYPDHWLIVHDTAFNHMREGKLFIVDPHLSGPGQIKGILSADFFASFLRGRRRNEFYVVETFHSRGGRGGERTDVVTFYDPASLDVQAEVVVPPKRLTGMPNRFQNTVTNDDRFLLIYNFTPAQSVSVVDLEQRVFVGEIPLPGCALTIPAGTSGFMSICSDGSVRSSVINDDGSTAGAIRVGPFIDVDDDAMMEKAAIINGIGYFPTFSGNVIPIDLRSHPVSVGRTWSLTSAEERAAGWRPGGAWPVTGDSDGRLYVLMHGHGAEGTHKDGGDQVWVFDAVAGKRLGQFELREWGLVLGMSLTTPPTLIVTGAAGGIDLYAVDGRHLSSLEVQTEFPLFVYGAR